MKILISSILSLLSLSCANMNLQIKEKVRRVRTHSHNPEVRAIIKQKYEAHQSGTKVPPKNKLTKEAEANIREFVKSLGKNIIFKLYDKQIKEQWQAWPHLNNKHNKNRVRFSKH